MATRFCNRFSVLSSTVGGVIWSESESDPSRPQALLDFLAFIGGRLKTDRGMSLKSEVDSWRYVENAGDGSSL